MHLHMDLIICPCLDSMCHHKSRSCLRCKDIVWLHQTQTFKKKQHNFPIKHTHLPKKGRTGLYTNKDHQEERDVVLILTSRNMTWNPLKQMWISECVHDISNVCTQCTISKIMFEYICLNLASFSLPSSHLLSCILTTGACTDLAVPPSASSGASGWTVARHWRLSC